MMLEASFDARHRPDDWTCQLLEAAASVAGLLLETERLATTPAPLTHGGARWRGAADRLQRGDAAAARARRARREHQLHRAHRRRKRRRQGAGGAPDSRAGSAPAGTVRRHQLRRAGRDADRGGAVRHRGAHRHRRARPPRQVRARRRRHVVSRRDLRSVDGRAGQAAARHSGPDRRARRRQRARARSTRASSRRPIARCPVSSIAGCSGPICSTG